MKRKPRKLQLRREAVRQLEGVELKRAGGAGNAVALDTEIAACPWTHATLVSANGGG